MLASATPVAPRRDTGAASTSGRSAPVVLDVRNSYEWDAGHFEGAARPQEDEFRETPRAEDSSDGLPEPLHNVDKDTPVMVRPPPCGLPALPLRKVNCACALCTAWLRRSPPPADVCCCGLQ